MLAGLAVSIEFLGLLDTVASVGRRMFYRALPVIWDGPIVLSNSLMRGSFPA